MNKERNYVINFKNSKIDPIQFRIIEKEPGNCRIPNGIKIKNEQHFHNGSPTHEQAIIWIKQTLWKYEIEEIKENE